VDIPEAEVTPEAGVAGIRAAADGLAPAAVWADPWEALFWVVAVVTAVDIREEAVILAVVIPVEGIRAAADRVR
jgi:hypothetical protein